MCGCVGNDIVHASYVVGFGALAWVVIGFATGGGNFGQKGD
jgi:hypothetical protein